MFVEDDGVKDEETCQNADMQLLLEPRTEVS